MRYYSLLFLFSLFVFVSFMGCTETETDIPTPELSFAEKVISEYDGIILSCKVTGNVTSDKLTIEYSKEQSLAGSQTNTVNMQGGEFLFKITGLEIQTTYYYRYTVRNKLNSYTDQEIRQFKTLDYIAPVVSTGEVKNVSGTKATLEGNIEFACGKEILEKGFLIGRSQDKLEAVPAVGKDFCLMAEGLEYGTDYYYQAYARSEIGTGKGEIKEFHTCEAVSFLETVVSEITASSAAVSGGILNSGGVDIEQQGFRFGEKASADYSFISSDGTSELVNLKAATTYTVWCYAKTFEGEFESEKVDFTTFDGLITFGTTIASDIKAASVSLSSSIIDDGGSPITEQGFVYGTEMLPTTDGSHLSLDGPLGQMTGNLTDLTNNTTYYIRPYAVNGVGVSYGAQITVNTLSGLADLGQVVISDIKAESAKFTSSIISSNGTTIINSGFCYGITKNPTVAGNVVYAVPTSGEIMSAVSSLEVSSKYYVRAFATTPYGTTYGPENSFATKYGTIVLSNINVSEILPESAKAVATISDDGGSSVTEHGFCYATSELPTINDKKVMVSSTESTYSGILSPLSRSTKYYVRAYAINGLGTYYSGQDEFTTLSGMASLATLVSSNVENTSATFSCEVSSDGGASISGRGFCYSTSPSPTINSIKKVVDGTVGSMHGIISGLEPGTTYYVRAYVTTKYGTVYSNEVQITTKLGLPTMSSVSITDIQPTTVTLSSGITAPGDGYILEKGFCYSTSPSPDKDDTIVYVMTDWTVSITELEQYTKYYVRSFATTQYGTAYSDEYSFTTTYYSVEFGDIFIENVGITNLTVSCPVTDYGGNDVIDEGFCYSITPSPSIYDSRLSSNATALIDHLSKDTKYYFRRYVINKVGAFYSSEVSTSTYGAPDEAICGVYSVSASQKIVFSPSSLIQTAEDVVAFATNQYFTSGEGSVLSNGVPQYPTDMFINGYLVSGSPKYSTLGSKWRALNVTEWEYLICGRTNAESLVYYNVCVNGINGLLLLPDGGCSSTIELTHNSVLSNSEFSKLEDKGVVFLPYTGFYGASEHEMLGVGTATILWAITNNKSEYAYLCINESGSYYKSPSYSLSCSWEISPGVYLSVFPMFAAVRLVANVN